MSQKIYRHDGLVLVVERAGSTASIAWQGASESRNPGQFLTPIIAELGRELRDAEITVDLRGLEYMNSSTVVPLIALIKRLDANGKPVRVLFLDVAWQRTHRNCMSAIARTLKNTRIENLAPSHGAA